MKLHKRICWVLMKSEGRPEKNLVCKDSIERYWIVLGCNFKRFKIWRSKLSYGHFEAKFF